MEGGCEAIGEGAVIGAEGRDLTGNDRFNGGLGRSINVLRICGRRKPGSQRQRKGERDKDCRQA